MINQLYTNLIKLTSMKKILLLAAVLVSSLVANAKVWRINPNEAARADFLNVTDATAAAKVNRGDTLYCEPGSYQGIQYVNKPALTIIGPGWEIPTNFGSTSTIAAASFSEQLRINTDSISITGLSVTYIYVAAVKHTTIERCMLGHISGAESWGDQISNLYIRNNFFTSNLGDTNTSIHFRGPGSILNVSIENNIFASYVEDGYYGFAKNIEIYANNYLNTSGLIAHNTFVGHYRETNNPIRMYYATIRDNIIINTSTYRQGTEPLPNESHWFLYSQVGTCEVYNNVFSCVEENVDADILSFFPNNHFIGATLDNTFTRTIVNNAAETAFRLKEGSAAANRHIRARTAARMQAHGRSLSAVVRVECPTSTTLRHPTIRRTTY